MNHFTLDGSEHLPPFQRALVERALRSGDQAWAERLMAMFAAGNEEVEEAASPPPPSGAARTGSGGSERQYR